MSSSFNPGGPNAPLPNDPYGQAPKKGGMLWLWIVLGVLGVGGILAVACCGGMAMFGLGAASTVIADSLRENPVIKEHIGDIESCSWNFSQSGQPDDKEAVAFDVKGSKGSGIVKGKISNGPGGSSGLERGTLTTSEGTFDLFPPVP